MKKTPSERLPALLLTALLLAAVDIKRPWQGECQGQGRGGWLSLLHGGLAYLTLKRQNK
jgi:hypothetical protein